MRVLHVLNTATFSGAENVACQIIKLYEDTDISMAYCSRNGSIKNKLDEFGIDFYPLEEMNMNELNRVIKKYKPNVIHAHDMRATYFACKNKYNIPVISHIHNNAYDSRRLSIKSIAFLIASRRIKHIFWVSEEALDQFVFSKLVKNKSSVLYNVISWDLVKKKLALDKKSYSYDVIFLGRLSNEKNPERFMDIIEKVYIKFPQLKVAIVGDGQLKDNIVSLIEVKKLTKVIDLLGFLNNPFKVLQDSKCMVMTSLREGLPMSAIESQMVGTPIVCTPVGALPNIVVNDYTGFLCNNDVDFINSIISIISNDELQKRLSENSIEFATKFNDPKVFMEKLNNQYK